MFETSRGDASGGPSILQVPTTYPIIVAFVGQQEDTLVCRFSGWERFLQNFCRSTSAYKSYHEWRSVDCFAESNHSSYSPTKKLVAVQSEVGHWRVCPLSK